MRLVIAGSRDLGTYKNKKLQRVQMTLEECSWMDQIWEEFEWKDRITEIISGKAKGVDNLGEQLADKYGIPKTIFAAEWDRFGNRAGPLRNSDMADYADVAIVIMKSGWSSGSRNMIQQMDKRKKPVLVYEIIGGKPCQVRLKK